MPHRRKPRKGSFGGHFDELVMHFPHEEREQPAGETNGASNDERGVHDRLFERAWRSNERPRETPH